MIPGQGHDILTQFDQNAEKMQSDQSNEALSSNRKIVNDLKEMAHSREDSNIELQEEEKIDPEKAKLVCVDGLTRQLKRLSEGDGENEIFSVVQNTISGQFVSSKLSHGNHIHIYNMARSMWNGVNLNNPNHEEHIIDRSSKITMQEAGPDALMMGIFAMNIITHYIMTELKEKLSTVHDKAGEDVLNEATMHDGPQKFLSAIDVPPFRLKRETSEIELDDDTCMPIGEFKNKHSLIQAATHSLMARTSESSFNPLSQLSLDKCNQEYDYKSIMLYINKLGHKADSRTELSAASEATHHKLRGMYSAQKELATDSAKEAVQSAIDIAFKSESAHTIQGLKDIYKIADSMDISDQSAPR